MNQTIGTATGDNCQHQIGQKGKAQGRWEEEERTKNARRCSLHFPVKAIEHGGIWEEWSFFTLCIDKYFSLVSSFPTELTFGCGYYFKWVLVTWYIAQLLCCVQSGKWWVCLILIPFKKCADSCWFKKHADSSTALKQLWSKLWSVQKFSLCLKSILVLMCFKKCLSRIYIIFFSERCIYAVFNFF